MGYRQYEACLFDLDGTLVDVEWQYVRETFDEVGDRLGRHFSDREASVLWHGLGGSRNDILGRYGVDVAEFWSVFDGVADPASRAAETFLYDDAAVVGDLDGPVGVVTHCPPAVTDAVLDELDVRDWFDAVVCCHGVPKKPDPEPVRLALDRLGVPADAAASLTGDARVDVGAAWNAGLDAIHVERHDPHRRELCVLGDYRVNSLSEVGGQVAADGGSPTD